MIAVQGPSSALAANGSTVKAGADSILLFVFAKR